MSITLLTWFGLFGLFALLAFVRPAWGVALYMLTFFACPPFWWWGNNPPISTYRWNLYSGVILLVAVLLSQLFSSRRAGANDPSTSKYVVWTSIAILINATMVHAFFASDYSISMDPYTLLAKFVLLFLLILASIRTRQDFNTILLAILLGAGYIGYEVTINDRGQLSGTRLEGIGAPGADQANQLASLMVTVLPMAGGLFLVGRPWQKLAMLPVAPFILNVILLCNSRGAFLGAISSVFALLMFAPSKVRRRALKLTALGCVATWFLLGDPRIVERFLTTFASAEERDNSAASRLTYWRAGIRMIADYPLGAGGDGFKVAHAKEYLAKVGVYRETRAVHNGYINEACEWGLQGLLLRMFFVGGACLVAARTSRLCAKNGRANMALLGGSLIAGMTGFLVTCAFGDRLDNEWGYWMAALALGYVRVCRMEIGFRPTALRGFAQAVDGQPQLQENAIYARYPY